MCQKLFFNKVTGLWLDIFLISLYSYVIRNIQIVLTVCLILTKIYFYISYLSFFLEKSYHLEAAIIHSEGAIGTVPKNPYIKVDKF